LGEAGDATERRNKYANKYADEFDEWPAMSEAEHR
jgi:hypothetical protein